MQLGMCQPLCAGWFYSRYLLLTSTCWLWINQTPRESPDQSVSRLTADAWLPFVWLMWTHCHLDGIYCSASDLLSLALSLKNVYFQTKQTPPPPPPPQQHQSMGRYDSLDGRKVVWWMQDVGVLLSILYQSFDGENILLPRIRVENKQVGLFSCASIIIFENCFIYMRWCYFENLIASGISI